MGLVIQPSRQCEDVATGFSDEDGVLELRRQEPILGDDRPTVVPHVVIMCAEGDHGFNSKSHASIHDGVVSGVVVVRDNEATVKCSADPMPREVSDDAVVESLRKTFDDSSDNVDGPAWSHGLDPSHRRLMSALNEQLCLLRNLPNRKGGVGIPVDPTDEGRDVDIADISLEKQG